MTGPSRRGALGALLGLGVTAWLGFGSSPVRAQSSILIPDNPLKLTRRIERSMRGGVMLTVERNWQVQFARQGQGLTVRGEQISAEVSAPQSLAPLVEVEEQRSTAQMWPVRLDANGMILSAGAGMREEDLAQAVRLARQMIGERPIPAAERAAQAQYVGDMQQASSSLLERLPDDLFYPSLGPLRAVRSIDLPQGMTGQFEISYSANAVPEKGWLDSAERQVISRIGESVRTAREEWHLRDL